MNKNNNVSYKNNNNKLILIAQIVINVSNVKTVMDVNFVNHVKNVVIVQIVQTAITVKILLIQTITFLISQCNNL